MEKLAFTIAEAAKTTTICRSGIYDAINAGELRAVKYGNRTVILAEDLHAFLKSLRAA